VLQRPTGDVGLERPATERRALVVDVLLGLLERRLGLGGVELRLLLLDDGGAVALERRGGRLRGAVEGGAGGVRVALLLQQLQVQRLRAGLGGERRRGRLLLGTAGAGGIAVVGGRGGRFRGGPGREPGRVGAGDEGHHGQRDDEQRATAPPPRITRASTHGKHYGRGRSDLRSRQGERRHVPR